MVVLLRVVFLVALGIATVGLVGGEEAFPGSRRVAARAVRDTAPATIVDSASSSVETLARDASTALRREVTDLEPGDLRSKRYMEQLRAPNSAVRKALGVIAERIGKTDLPVSSDDVAVANYIVAVFRKGDAPTEAELDVLRALKARQEAIGQPLRTSANGGLYAAARQKQLQALYDRMAGREGIHPLDEKAIKELTAQPSLSKLEEDIVQHYRRRTTTLDDIIATTEKLTPEEITAAKKRIEEARERISKRLKESGVEDGTFNKWFDDMNRNLFQGAKMWRKGRANLVEMLREPQYRDMLETLASHMKSGEIDPKLFKKRPIGLLAGSLMDKRVAVMRSRDLFEDVILTTQRKFDEESLMADLLGGRARREGTASVGRRATAEEGIPIPEDLWAKIEEAATEKADELEKLVTRTSGDVDVPGPAVSTLSDSSVSGSESELSPLLRDVVGETERSAAAGTWDVVDRAASVDAPPSGRSILNDMLVDAGTASSLTRSYDLLEDVMNQPPGSRRWDAVIDKFEEEAVRRMGYYRKLNSVVDRPYGRLLQVDGGYYVGELPFNPAVKRYNVEVLDKWGKKVDPRKAGMDVEASLFFVQSYGDQKFTIRIHMEGWDGSMIKKDLDLDTSWGKDKEWHIEDQGTTLSGFREARRREVAGFRVSPAMLSAEVEDGIEGLAP